MSATQALRERWDFEFQLRSDSSVVVRGRRTQLWGGIRAILVEFEEIAEIRGKSEPPGESIRECASSRLASTALDSWPHRCGWPNVTHAAPIGFHCGSPGTATRWRAARRCSASGATARSTWLSARGLLLGLD